MTETTEWFDADGASLALDVDWDVSGRFMPKIEAESDGIPGRAGAVLRQTRHGVREFVMGVWVQGVGDTGLRTALRSMVDRMDPTRGAGRIRVTSPLGDQREITCYYAAGLEMAERLGDASGPDFQRIPLAFTAYDPYWYDVSPVSSPVWTVTDAPSFFPFFPLRLTASELVVDEIITNGGSVEAWPVWTIRGPGAGAKLTNTTTGQYLYFPALTLGAGQYITVDTRPGVKSVLLDDGTNLYPQLDTGSSLWPLQRGDNAIRLEMSGVSVTDSSLQVSYWRRYLSP